MLVVELGSPGHQVGGDRQCAPSSPACPWSSSRLTTRSARIAGMLVVEFKLGDWPPGRWRSPSTAAGSADRSPRAAAIAGAAELADMPVVELAADHQVGDDRRRGRARRHARGRARRWSPGRRLVHQIVHQGSGDSPAARGHARGHQVGGDCRRGRVRGMLLVTLGSAAGHQVGGDRPPPRDRRHAVVELEQPGPEPAPISCEFEIRFHTAPLPCGCHTMG
jgi:hypothetical protein